MIESRFAGILIDASGTRARCEVYRDYRYGRLLLVTVYLVEKDRGGWTMPVRITRDITGGFVFVSAKGKAHKVRLYT